MPKKSNDEPKPKKPLRNTRVNDKEIEEKENYYIRPKVFQEELWNYYQFSEKAEELDNVWNSDENVELREKFSKLEPDDHSREAEEIRKKYKELDDFYRSDDAKYIRQMRRRWYEQCRTLMREAG